MQQTAPWLSTVVIDKDRKVVVMSETSITSQLQELVSRESAFKDAEDAVDQARACVTDLLSRRCVAVAKKLGIESAKNFRDVAVVPQATSWKISWTEYFQYEVYDRVVITIPATLIDLSDHQFLADIDTIAPQCSATSDVTEMTAHRKQEQESKDRRELERLQRKYAPAAEGGTV